MFLYQHKHIGGFSTLHLCTFNSWKSLTIFAKSSILGFETRHCWLDIILFLEFFPQEKKEIFWSFSNLDKTIRFKYPKKMIFVKFLCLDKCEFLRDSNLHCVKSVRIRIFCCPYFPAFRLNTERYYWQIRSITLYSVGMQENTDPKNSQHGHFSRSANLTIKLSEKISSLI